ncbi:Uncharacterised protein [Vibrio cholerae]|nr:Uncharacterised protein [Vibrio cholerae]CSI09025.1 Uncharacterised protein [Vibrio cholerae]
MLMVFRSCWLGELVYWVDESIVYLSLILLG